MKTDKRCASVAIGVHTWFDFRECDCPAAGPGFDPSNVWEGYDALMDRSLRELMRLQSFRARAPANLAIDRAVAQIEHQASSAHRRLGECVQAWRQVAPPHIASASRVHSFSRGVLTIIVESAAHAFEIDRLLRSGLDARLRQDLGGSLVRVKTRMGSLDAEPAPIAAERAASNSSKRGRSRRTTEAVANSIRITPRAAGRKKAPSRRHRD